MKIIDQIRDGDVWEEFLGYKTRAGHLSRDEQKSLRSYIDERSYLSDTDLMTGELPLARKVVISKIGGKKRTVYIYPEGFGYILKMITYLLSKYDGMFSDSCYAFRHGRCSGDAVRKLRGSALLSMYAVKADIHDYFNSIDPVRLLGKLSFLKEEEPEIYDLFEKILLEDRVIFEGKVITEKRKGAMAGIPVSAFFANVYLSDTDRFFEGQGIPYFRYSDDILLFGKTREEALERRDILYERIAAEGLEINPGKVAFYEPGQGVEFLGFRFKGNMCDVSSATLGKIKAKIRRKARTMRRWAYRKDLSSDKAAKGFIKAMNYKFFDCGEDDRFSWSRWFFPYITTADSLKVIDSHMQEYIRYCVTGRHYKGNYKISYDTMRDWGYRNLVHEYYNFDTSGRHEGDNCSL